MYTFDGLKLFKSLEKAAQYVVDSPPEYIEQPLLRLSGGETEEVSDWEFQEYETWKRHYTLPL